MQVQGTPREACPSHYEDHSQESCCLHDSAPAFLRRTSHISTVPAARRARPRASKNASAVPVVGAPNTLSICMPAGNSVGTRTVLFCPSGFTTTSSTATNEVKRVTSLYWMACAITLVCISLRWLLSDSLQ